MISETCTVNLLQGGAIGAASKVAEKIEAISSLISAIADLANLIADLVSLIQDINSLQSTFAEMKKLTADTNSEVNIFVT